MGMGGGMGNDAQPNSNNSDVVLATLNVTGNDVQTLPSVAAQPKSRDLIGAVVARRRELTYAMGMGGGSMSFTIDGKEFKPSTPAPSRNGRSPTPRR
jgi:hypothetical protein